MSADQDTLTTQIIGILEMDTNKQHTTEKEILDNSLPSYNQPQENKDPNIDNSLTTSSNIPFTRSKAHNTPITLFPEVSLEDIIPTTHSPIKTKTNKSTKHTKKEKTDRPKTKSIKKQKAIFTGDSYNYKDTKKPKMVTSMEINENMNLIKDNVNDISKSSKFKFANKSLNRMLYFNQEISNSTICNLDAFNLSYKENNLTNSAAFFKLTEQRRKSQDTKTTNIYELLKALKDYVYDKRKALNVPAVVPRVVVPVVSVPRVNYVSTTKNNTEFMKPEFLKEINIIGDIVTPVRYHEPNWAKYRANVSLPKHWPHQIDVSDNTKDNKEINDNINTLVKEHCLAIEKEKILFKRMGIRDGDLDNDGSRMMFTNEIKDTEIENLEIIVNDYKENMNDIESIKYNTKYTTENDRKGIKWNNIKDRKYLRIEK